jgi:hypothetical protein
MRYLILLKGNRPADPPPELMDAIMKLGAEATAAGALLDTAGLAPSAAGARVSLYAGQMSVTDGPFAEAKEYLGGLTIVDAPDLDAALGWGRKAARAVGLPIEVRPFDWA